MRQIEMFIGDYNPRLDMLGWTGLYIKGLSKGAPGTSLHALMTGLFDRAGNGGNGWKLGRRRKQKPIIILLLFEFIYFSNCLQC